VIFDHSVGPHPEHYVAVQVRLSGNQITDHVEAHHLFVHRVSFDVLAVERQALWRRAQPLQGLDQSARSRRRGDLRRREVL
jgi:hypothetical protein